MSQLSVPLDDIDECFQGAFPSVLCSVSKDGIPNVTYLSIVHRLDDSHVGLSRQFFNKTIKNMLENPKAQARVLEPTSGRAFRLNLLYERTETEGPLFDRVSANLDAVASYEGLRSLFKLAAVDVCRVLACEKVPSDWDQVGPRRTQAGFDALDTFSLRLVEASDVEKLITVALDSCAELFGYEHAFILFLDESGERLYTVGSRGYETSGVGAEVGLGEGIIGTAAQRRQAFRAGNIASDIAYAQAVRSGIARSGGGEFGRNIALPGLPNVLSQIAVPITGHNQLLGVLCVESASPGRFGARDEAILNVAARQIGLSLLLLRFNRDREPMITARIEQPPQVENAAVVKYYPLDDSVFVDNEYLIKGVAGRILWRLLRNYADERRVEFTNKEIRLDPSLDLPDIKDNLEARLVLLRRRLDERCGFLKITNTGRGRFHLDVQREVRLQDAGA